MKQITWDDLSLDIQTKMLIYQIEQGNPYNPDIFINKPTADFSEGGFDVYLTKEGSHYWKTTLDAYADRFFKNIDGDNVYAIRVAGVSSDYYVNGKLYAQNVYGFARRTTDIEIDRREFEKLIN